MPALILKINEAKPDKRKIRIAAEAIKAGRLVVFPTETVYGIGANAFDENACRRIFKVKGRPSDNPLIVHVSSLEMADKICSIPERYRKIITRIWPSPITFLVKAKSNLPRVVTAGLDTVCIRMPENRVALELIRESGVPIAAPSANISMKPSSTSAKHALKYFKDSVDIIINSGNSAFGLESTILDLNNFKLLRAGSFTVEEILKAFGRKPSITRQVKGLAKSGKAISPGMKYGHYSPDTPLFLFTGNKNNLYKILKGQREFAFIGSAETEKKIRKTTMKMIVLGGRRNLREVARNLFDGLISLDSLGARFAVAESFEEEGYGLAIMNRLRKASAGRKFKTGKELGRLVKGLHGFS